MNKNWAMLKLLLTFGVLCVPSLMAGSKLSAELQGLPPAASVDVIIQFTRSPSAADLSVVNHAGGVLKQTLWGIHAGVFRLNAHQLNAAASNPNIVYISPDRAVSGSLEFAEPTVNANIAFQYGWTGAGVGVAIIDSGVYNHPDLRPRVVHSESFVPGQWSTHDAYGHGTHVAGIVAGNGANSTGPITSILSAELRHRRILLTCECWIVTVKARIHRSSRRSTERSS